MTSVDPPVLRSPGTASFLVLFAGVQPRHHRHTRYSRHAYVQPRSTVHYSYSYTYSFCRATSRTRVPLHMHAVTALLDRRIGWMRSWTQNRRGCRTGMPPSQGRISGTVLPQFDSSCPMSCCCYRLSRRTSCRRGTHYMSLGWPQNSISLIKFYY